MKRSTERILTTHTGSLPRPADLVAMVEGHDQRDLQGNEAFASRVKSAVHEIVRGIVRQAGMQYAPHVRLGLKPARHRRVGSAAMLDKDQTPIGL